MTDYVHLLVLERAWGPWSCTHSVQSPVQRSFQLCVVKKRQLNSKHSINTHFTSLQLFKREELYAEL